MELQEAMAVLLTWPLRYFQTRNFCHNYHCAQAAANPWDLSGLDPMAGGATGARPKNAVESLLGEHSDLVNLDNLTQV